LRYLQFGGLVVAIVGVLLACAPTAPAPGGTTVPTAAPAVTTAPADRNYTVRIGYPATVRDQPAPGGPDVWALNQGLFDAEFKADEIKIQFIPFLAAGPAINEALTAGSLDLGAYAVTPGLLGKASGVKTSLVVVTDASGPGWLLVRGDSPAKKVSDLKGKKIATIKGTFPHRLLLDILKANGMTASDIQLVNMNFADSEAALTGGQVDAIISVGVNAFRMMQQGNRSIFSTDDLPPARGLSVIVANDSFIAAHPSFFARYYRVRAKAIEWANANRDAALEQMAKASGMGTDASLMAKLYPDQKFNFDLAMTPDILGRIKAEDSFLQDAGLTRQPVDVDAWISRAVAYKPS
jgi:sulfonate transport system substrate-binding protein